MPLLSGAVKAHDTYMFSVYCPKHGARVLLSVDNILALINDPDGVRLRWRCSCGQTGISPAEGLTGRTAA
jgi:hypothetical protein